MHNFQNKQDYKLNIMFNEIRENIKDIHAVFDNKFKDNYYSTDELINQIEDFFTNYCFFSMNIYNLIGLIIAELKNNNSKDFLVEEKNSSSDN